MKLIRYAQVFCLIGTIFFTIGLAVYFANNYSASLIAILPTSFLIGYVILRNLDIQNEKKND